MCRESGLDIDIQVDGGIKESTVERVARAGADCFVMGSACFTAADPAAAMGAVRALGAAAARESVN
jgi:ribulose-phosphate 3-epimerase